MNGLEGQLTKEDMYNLPPVEPATKKFQVTITAKNEPLYNLPSNDQMYFTPDGKLFVVYDDDHDEDPNKLHDVTDQYIVKVEEVVKSNNVQDEEYNQK